MAGEGVVHGGGGLSSRALTRLQRLARQVRTRFRCSMRPRGGLARLAHASGRVSVMGWGR